MSNEENDFDNECFINNKNELIRTNNNNIHNTNVNNNTNNNANDLAKNEDNMINDYEDTNNYTDTCDNNENSTLKPDPRLDLIVIDKSILLKELSDCRTKHWK